MRVFCRWFVCFFLCAVAGFAGATRINVLDPLIPVNGITNADLPTFPVSFVICSSFFPNANPVPNGGCFGFANQTSSAWTGLDLFLSSSDPSTFNFSCNDNPPGTPVFSATTWVQ